MTPNTIFSRLARFACDLTLDSLPAEVVTKVDHCLLDLIGATYGALSGPGAAALRRYALATNASPDAVIWGTSQRAGAAEVAMLHGAAGYELEFDDGISLGGHWGSSAIPAILALAERERASAEDVVLAIVAAYEVGTRISRTLAKGLLNRGIHFPGLMGAIATAVGAGRILRLDAATLAQALGHCGLLPVAPYQPAFGGSLSKNLYSGWPNLAGIHFAGMARAGYGGPPDVFEAEKGLAQALCWQGSADALAALALRDLGTRFAILETYFKPYPCCRWLHAPARAVLDLLPRGKDPAAIANIHVMAPGFLGMYNDHGPYTEIVTAKYSLPYCVAAAARWGKLDRAEFEETARRDGELNRLAGIVSFSADAELEAAFPGVFTSRVEITLQDGRLLTATARLPWGPDAPPNLAALSAKFTPLMQEACGAEAAADWLWYFDRGLLADGDLSGLLALFRRPLLQVA